MVDREPQRLDERLVGNAELLLAAAEQHDRTLVVDLSRELRRETGLADAGLTGEEDETGMGIVAGDHLPRRGQLLQRLGSTHERELLRRPERGGKRQDGDRADRGERFPPHDARLDRIGQALQRERSDGIELVATASSGELPHECRDDDLPAVRRRAQPRRFDHRRAEQVVTLSPRVPGADADAEHDQLLAARRLLDLDRGSDRVGRAVGTQPCARPRGP